MGRGSRFCRVASAMLSVGALVALVAAAPESAPLDPASYQKEIETWRAQRIADIKRQDGWLSYIGRFGLEEGESRIGSDPAAQVVLPAGKAPRLVGTLVRHGDSVTFVPAPGLAASLTAERHLPADHGLLAPAPAGAALTGPLALTYDGSAEQPTVVHVGTISFFVIQRLDQWIVRIQDSQAPALATFKGIDTFPVRADLRVVASYEPYNPPKPIPITTVVGEAETWGATGAVVFERDGKTYRLDAVEESGGRLFIVFGDKTNGFETYGAGRFLDTEGPQDGRVVVDFNKAYNPPCAISTYAVCPLPPPQNRLQLRVTAGEKTIREHA
jgi:uncharacterized protein